MKPVLLFCLFCLCVSWSFAQTLGQKRINAVRSTVDLVIDGVLDEDVWANTEIASGLRQNRPNPGQPASQPTEIRVLYDDEFLYIGAEMYDNSPDSILHQLSQRDQIENSDMFGFWISSFRDGINAFEFMVTPDGVQLDALVSADGEDFNWNAVWQCNTQIHDRGWTAEFKIPYSAFRFAEAEEQVWDMNFWRNIRRHREQSFWQFVDPEQPGLIQQTGKVQNIMNIEPPVRLFFFPYASAYYETKGLLEGGITTGTRLNGGMDIKYGINESFTLDMTLIPDFGQVQSDNQVLNLGPFEIFFNEQRQFFTEGTELFSKGDLFYSRRIGERPINTRRADEALQDGEEIKELPFETQLLNATKISGRNRNGLGIGMLNAVVNSADAVLSDGDGNERTVEVAPLTNYHILVLDQNLKNNSYVSLINTNVLRNGETYDANVIGTEFAVRNEKNTIEVNGFGAYNKKFNYDDPDSDDGYAYSVGVDKIGGNWTYGISHNIESDTYDINDFGFLFAPNEQKTVTYIDYNQYKPFGKFVRGNIETSASYNRLYNPDVFTEIDFNISGSLTTLGFHSFGFKSSFSPVELYDYFEPRKEGAYIIIPERWSGSMWFSSDYRRMFALDLNFWTDQIGMSGWHSMNYRFAPRLRLNDKLFMTYVYSWQQEFNQRGFAGFDIEDNVVIGTRDVISHTNVFNLSYIFTNRMGVTFRARHYWSHASYNAFAYLAEGNNLFDASSLGFLSSEFNQYTISDGNGGETIEGIDESGVANNNRSFNAFNVDLVYTWVFSPGSEIRIVWKNSILDNDNIIPDNWSDNFSNTFELPQTNSFSIRFLYFIDYLSLKRKQSAIKN